ncbi:hypothetical protein [Companilactobacillus alimentarius]|nr:hypothetical protein [Companilactobacillus alimentarius]MDT6953145.1 hypothetical protein [Companilactobacillus alimentarius]
MKKWVLLMEEMEEKIDSSLLNESYQNLAEIVGVENMLKIRYNYCGMQL